jgi:hypothetical protein
VGCVGYLMGCAVWGVGLCVSYLMGCEVWGVSAI